MIMWPAVMFAKRRTIRENGLVKIPTNSIGIMIGNKATGTPGVLKCGPSKIYWSLPA